MNTYNTGSQKDDIQPKKGFRAMANSSDGSKDDGKKSGGGTGSDNGKLYL